MLPSAGFRWTFTSVASVSLFVRGLHLLVAVGGPALVFFEGDSRFYGHEDSRPTKDEAYERQKNFAH